MCSELIFIAKSKFNRDRKKSVDVSTKQKSTYLYCIIAYKFKAVFLFVPIALPAGAALFYTQYELKL